MQIKINLKIFIFIIIFYITGQIQMYGVLMFFALLHELGHLVVGVLLKFKPKSISIIPVGLSISFKVRADDYNKKIIKGNLLTLKKLLIVMAGPAVNIIIAIIFNVHKYTLLGISSEVIIYSNVLIAMFNLIPIYPLDGGRIVKCILSMLCGIRKSSTYINYISNATIIIITTLIIISVWYLRNIAMVVVLIYLWYLVISENKRFKNMKIIYELWDKGDKGDKGTDLLSCTFGDTP